MFRVLRKTDLIVKSAALLLAAIAMVGAPASVRAYTFDDVEVTAWAGIEPDDGVSEALMVIDWQIPSKDSLVLGYRWTGQASGMDMLNEFDQSENRFYMVWHPSYPGALYGIGWDADGDGFAKTDPDDYYEEGWMEGSWRYFNSIDGEDWTYSGSGAQGRTLSDGDWDGWSWAPLFQITPPDNIPEAVSGVDLPGDSNGDGAVNDLDYDNLIIQFGGEPGVNSADFNGDNVVNLADFAILRENFGAVASSAPGVGPAVPAPEPTTVMLLALGGAGLLARRRG